MHFVRHPEAGELRTHPIVRMEFLHDAYRRAEFNVRLRMFRAYQEVPLAESDGRVAIQALYDLSSS